MQRRTWMCVAMIDKYISVFTGRPSLSRHFPLPNVPNHESHFQPFIDQFEMVNTLSEICSCHNSGFDTSLLQAQQSKLNDMLQDLAPKESQLLHKSVAWNATHVTMILIYTVYII